MQIIIFDFSHVVSKDRKRKRSILKWMQNEESYCICSVQSRFFTESHQKDYYPTAASRGVMVKLKVTDFFYKNSIIY